MGAIKKPDGSVRSIHDGTHFVQVNNGIRFTDKLDYPGPPDVAGAVRAARDTQDSFFTVSADIKAAHRLVKIRESDWRLLVCKSNSDSDVYWVNKVGTFGCLARSISGVDFLAWLVGLLQGSLAQMGRTAGVLGRPLPMAPVL